MSQEKKESPRGANWILTIYPDSNNIPDLGQCITDWTSTGKITGLVAQEEICPTTQRLHFQAYVRFKNSVRLAQVKSIFGSGVHAELRKGTEMEAIAYCSKLETRKPDTSPFFFGEMGKQGVRSDLEEIKTMIIQKKSEKEIAEAHFGDYLRYYKGIREVKNLFSEEKRNWKMKNIIIWGKPGTGKTWAATKYNPDSWWIKEPTTKWWDGYNYQEIVIIDDYDHNDPTHLNINYMLRLMDRYPMRVECKGSTMEFSSKTIVITANQNPKEWFPNSRQRDAFFRRIDEIIEI